MASIPNVQPSTMIIIVSSLVFGIRFGLTLTVITVLGSNLVLGLGIHAIMQVIAWGVVAIVSGAMKSFYERVPHILMATFSGVTGFLYGFTVSLNMLLILGPIGFYTYWLAGIPFDLNHAVGNFVFYLSAAPVLLKILSDQKNRL
ncbi:MAG: ECF transporter S component [Bacillaceae bacterium]|nr:ECF transporter S component [Bacillaceae bacterium]